LVPVDRPVECPVTTGTFAAAAGIAEPTIADPAIPSARIAGMIKARPMRMTPPPQLPGLAGCGCPRLARPSGETLKRATYGGIPLANGK
jgi:hypothetical protein